MEVPSQWREGPEKSLSARRSEHSGPSTLSHCYVQSCSFQFQSCKFRCKSDATRHYEQPLVAPEDGQAWQEPARYMMSPQT